MDVYRIPLKYLYYNDKNGRISTAIAGYHDELNQSTIQLISL